MQQVMAGQSFSSAEELLSAIGAILKSIRKVILIAIFLELMKRLVRSVSTSHKYTELLQ
jgi:hypothetical protein